MCPDESLGNSQTNDRQLDQQDGVDPLLEGLIAIAACYGRRLSRQAAVAGLPLQNGQLTLQTLPRAASRAQLSCRILKQDLAQLNLDLLPAILLLNEQRSCILLDLDHKNLVAGVIFPEMGDARVEMSLEKLQEKYAGHVVYMQPRFRFDARSPEVGQVRRRHWFWGVMADNRAIYRDVLVSAFLLSLFALAMPLFVRVVYDRVIPNQATYTLWVMAAGVAIVILGDLFLRTMRSYFLDLASKRIDVKLSAYIMERVLGTRLEYRPVSAGSFASNLRAFETVRDFITSTTITAFIDLPFAVVFIVVIGLIAWQMTIPIVIGLLLILAIAWIVQGQMHDLSETTYRAAAQRNSTLIESLVGLETVKAQGGESRMQGHWERSVNFLAQVSNRLRLLSAGTVNSALWITQTVNIVLILIGVYLLIDNQLTMGGLIACSMLSSRALAPINQVAGLLTQYHQATTSFSSLNKILDQPLERPPESQFLSRQHLDGAIEFRDVSLSYPGQETLVLNRLSFAVSPGEKVAILGRVGSGKSSLLKLILGLYQPTEGAIAIDEVDLRQIDPSELRRYCGYVAQDTTLFYGTLRDNITLGHVTYEDDAIGSAAITGGLGEFVNSHPSGFDMMIGERGENLSGGQRQGVAIARAVLKDPPVLLLDEPTGAMDHSCEDVVKKGLRRLSGNKTMILVTHRTSLLELVDRIIVLDSGRLVADGPRDKVLADLRAGNIGRVS